jgi:hypothetical protein
MMLHSRKKCEAQRMFINLILRKGAMIDFARSLQKAIDVPRIPKKADGCHALAFIEPAYGTIRVIP